MLYYDEVFVSIQGESSDMGYPCLFIRLWGCHVGCSYCDQIQTKGQRKKLSITNMMNKVLKELNRYPTVRHVCITGGEPLIQEDCFSMVYELVEKDYKVSIETSGCIPIPQDYYRRSFKYVMDVKCPSSGVAKKNKYDNLLLLHAKDEVKFVISDRGDYDFMLSTLHKYPTSAKILVSPMYDRNEKPVIGADLISWMLEDKFDARLQVQMHKVLNVL